MHFLKSKSTRQSLGQRFRFALPIVFWLAGCTVGKISPPLPATYEAELENALKSVVLGIADSTSPVIQTTGHRLKYSLQQTGLFRKVAMMSELNQRPDLILDSYENARFGFPVGFQCFEPYLTVLTVGIIPQTCEAEDEISFKLRRPGRTPVSFEPRHIKEKSISGWAALPLMASPEWTSDRKLERQLWVSIFASRKHEVLSLLR